MRLVLSLSICLCCILQLCQAQDQEFSLDSLSLEAFESESLHNYNLLFDCILNIIDNKLPLDDRLRSKNAMQDLFFNTGTKVWDYLDTKFPKYYKAYEYGNALLNVNEDLPLYYKRYKLSDDLELEEKLYRGKFESADSTFAIYNGELFLLEELINSIYIPQSVLNKAAYNAYNEGIMKKVSVRIAHDHEGYYRLSIKSIDIVDKQNNSLDYNKRKKLILNSNSAWSDIAKKDLLVQLEKEALNKGIMLSNKDDKIEEISQNNKIKLEENDSASMNVKENSQEVDQFSKPTVADFIIPGLGHPKYSDISGNSFWKYSKTAIFGGLFIASTSVAVVNRINSNENYKRHKQAKTLRISDEYYEIANRQHQRYRLASYVAIGTWVSNSIIIALQNTKQKKLLKEGKYNKIGLNVEMTHFQHSMGLSLTASIPLMSSN